MLKVSKICSLIQKREDITRDITRVVLNDSAMMTNTSYSQQGTITAEGELIDGFLAAICNDSNGFDVLDQVAELEEILSLNMMSAKQGKESFTTLNLERNTWRLVGRLYHDDFMQAQNMNQNTIDNPLVSEKEIIESAFTTDKVRKK